MFFTTSFFRLVLTSLGLLLSLSPVIGQIQQTLFPAAVPLAVRSPYLSCWEPTTNGSKWSDTWSTIATGGPILGWAGIVRVDGIAYAWLGNQDGTVPSMKGVNSSNLTQTTITPTRTISSIQAGPVKLTLTFLSPIEPGDWVRQSMPFSYMSLDVESQDGSAHAVQVYSDVSGEWNSGNRSGQLTWATSTSSASIFHAATLANQAPFVEKASQAEWGTLYYAAKAGTGVTYKTSSDANCRQLFMSQGVLDNQLDTTFRIITGTNDNPFPVFAISQDFGTIQSTPNPAVWVVGFSRDPALQYTDLSGAPTQRNLFYKTKYAKDSDLVNDFLNDFENASARATQLDNKILSDANGISSDYSDILAFAARQAYGATEITIGKNSDGSFNTSDVMMFMKNIGGTVPGRVNAVETLYAAFPMFMYIDPTLGAPLLEPLLRFQVTPAYQVGFAAADLGSKYPNATASNQKHQQGVEQTGNMLIMVYAYARASGDGTLVARYYDLFKTWADYLVANTLLIENQLSGDGESVSNQTNLAVKGIIAVQAMSGLSSALNRTADAQSYASTASTLIGQWKSLALAPDKHLLAVYGDQASSWTLGYNLLADRWLGTGLIDSTIYDGHTKFLQSLQQTTPDKTLFGIPMDSTNTAVTFSSWNLFAAAITTDTTVRDSIISSVHARASFNVSAGAFPVSYDSSRGSTILGIANPAQGAAYAQLALKIPVAAITVNNTALAAGQPSTNKSTAKKVNAGAVVGGVLAAIAALIAGGLLFYFLRRRQRNLRARSLLSTDSLEAGRPQDEGITPFEMRDDAQFQPVSIASQPALASSLYNSYSTNDGSMTPNTERRAPESEYSQPQTLSDVSAMIFVPPPSVPPSDKTLARLRMMNAARARGLTSPESPASPSTYESGSLPVAGSSAPAPLPAAPAVDANQLRVEVEDLRREMEQIRAERMEPPPLYES